MTPTSRERLAVMFTDAVGFSALTHRDEAGTLARLDAHRTIFRAAFQRHGGWEVKSTGDGFLVAFADPRAAVACALEIQSQLAGTAGDDPLMHRIGIHYGEVTRDGDDILGEVVNVAARVEPLAEPGGVVVTGEVRAAADQPGVVAFSRLGRAGLKNIGGLVPVYVASTPAQAPGAWVRLRFYLRQPLTRQILLAGALALFVGAAIYTLWPSPPPSEPVVLVVADAKNETGLESLDGAAAMLATLLEQSPYLVVPTRARLFDAVGQPLAERRAVDEATAKLAGRNIGADQVLTSRLMPAATGIAFSLEVYGLGDEKVVHKQVHHAADASALPELIDDAAAELRIHFRESSARLASRPAPVTRNMEAYAHYFRAEERISAGNVGTAAEDLLTATTLDPGFALAWYRLAYVRDWQGAAGARDALDEALRLGIPTDRERRMAEALRAKMAGRTDAAIRILDETAERYPHEKEALYMAGDIAFHAGQLELAIEKLEAVLELDRQFVRAYQHLVWALNSAGRHDEMVTRAREHLQAVPSFEASHELGWTLLAAGRFDESIEAYRTAFRAYPSHTDVGMGLCGALFFSGRLDEAETCTSDLPTSGQPTTEVSALHRTNAWLAVLGGRYRDADRLYEEIVGPGRHALRAVRGRAEYAFQLALRRGSRDQVETAYVGASGQFGTRVIEDLFVRIYLTRAALALGRLEDARTLASQPTPHPELTLLVEAEELVAAGRTAEGLAKLDDIARGTSTWFRVLASDRTAELALEQGDYRRAAAASQVVLGTYQMNEFIAATWSRALLSSAMALEKQGRAGEAAERYREFLNRWRAADDDRPEVATAREGLARIERQ